MAKSPAEPCRTCGSFCAEVGGVAACEGDGGLYTTRYECDGHPFGRVGATCGWSGVLQGSDVRDPQCPKCGGWVRKVEAAKLRRVR